jgi:hypothetical protein
MHNRRALALMSAFKVGKLTDLWPSCFWSKRFGLGIAANHWENSFAIRKGHSYKSVQVFFNLSQTYSSDSLPVRNVGRNTQGGRAE